MNFFKSKMQPAMRENNMIPAQPKRRELVDQAWSAVNDFYNSLEEIRVTPEVDASTIRNYLQQFDFATPLEPDQVLEQVTERMKNWNLHTPHPRYFGLFNPASSIYSVVADLLVAGFNPQLGAWHHNPFGVEIEAHLIRFFAEQFGLGEKAYGHFTSGGSEANFSAVVVALTRAFPTFAKSGVRGLAGQPTIYCSREFHHSFIKIAHQCGLGRSAVRLVPVTSDCVMDVDELQKLIASDRQNGLLPFMVVATGGTTNAGLVEPIDEIGNVSRQEGLHFHVDAAWGGSAILSDRHKPTLAGIENSDSITIDPHKLLSVSMGAGMFLVRDHAWLRAAFGLTTDYVPQSPTENLDNYRQSFQFSRRFIGLKLFLTLAAMGREGMGQMIDRQFEMARVLADKLEVAGCEVVNGASMGVVCFVPPAEWGLESHTELEQLAQAVCQSGQAWISTTRLGGRSVFRACITNHLTDEDDLSILVDTIVNQR